MRLQLKPPKRLLPLWQRQRLKLRRRRQPKMQPLRKRPPKRPLPRMLSLRWRCSTPLPGAVVPVRVVATVVSGVARAVRISAAKVQVVRGVAVAANPATQAAGTSRRQARWPQRRSWRPAGRQDLFGPSAEEGKAHRSRQSLCGSSDGAEAGRLIANGASGAEDPDRQMAVACAVFQNPQPGLPNRSAPDMCA